MLKRAEKTFELKPGCLGADKSYGTGPFLTWLLVLGTALHIPVLDRPPQTEGMFTRASFRHQDVEDICCCPSGYRLSQAGFERRTGM